ncbi:TIGR02391 family protein [Bradyrhizobium sp. SSUT18]|uniref:TIGR02391 family protein n=1 Tax=Bradyrhizobium sp. SSUT18 TaxID=3040602 RepID=UPI002448ACAC|nr:TIGR02391 family protein [Bradyrhizobium sp. SSUT18]MDH2402407.1 TIGR02391 family protein [Bradyrhizobium sp. SSUT18]
MVLLELMQAVRAPLFTVSEFEMPLWNTNLPEYPHHKRRAVGRAMAEAWQWLENEGLMMADPEQPNGYFCLTRKGAALKSPANVEAYQHGKLLPEGLLHEKLIAKVRPFFLRGGYDVAVVQAFKLVEVAVRSAAELSEDLTGQKLMREAFHPEKGPLRDKLAPSGERQALMELFSGAFGLARNPPSHRDVAISRVEAAQLIGFASYLLTTAGYCPK